MCWEEKQGWVDGPEFGVCAPLHSSRTFFLHGILASGARRTFPPGDLVVLCRAETKVAENQLSSCALTAAVGKEETAFSLGGMLLLFPNFSNDI